SVILVSHTNQVLLLHRVKSSSSFPSAHVFPGGNLSEFHDGRIPGPDQPGRHDDSEPYRLAAVRETFEESGILLARNRQTGRLLEIKEKEREEGRRAVYSGDISFPKWLHKYEGVADIENLIPFTRWVTPASVPKRFTTQMYIYFLPVGAFNHVPEPPPSQSEDTILADSDGEIVIPTPTHDGGIEHTAARFLSSSAWLSRARTNKIILFPPQFLLLYLVSSFFSSSDRDFCSKPAGRAMLERQRGKLKEFIHSGDPPWGIKVISPRPVAKARDGRSILDLSWSGAELEGCGRTGEKDLVVLTNFKKEGPRDVDVMKRLDVDVDVGKLSRI
ncbi:putative NUDIX family hydrolase, partial [Patellaria atrata CBS 101060]